MGRKELARLDIGAEIRKEKDRGGGGGETKFHKWTNSEATQRVEVVFSI